MSGVEVLAALGIIGTELFTYNRKSYEFDQDQRFEKEELRLKMQVERFKLFREDIRDLVELTVGKMDLYHVIGAFFAKMCVIYYCEGIIRGEIPPYLLMLYYLSASCSFVYLMLAIWLAMHASISAHSYGTRLLTRFVRLPIPSAAQMSLMNARYADFEKQGREMFRVPFFSEQGNRWRPRSAQEEAAGAAASSSSGAGGGDGQADAAARAEADAELLGLGARNGPRSADVDDELLQAVDFRTERHVQLFRRLQGKWQCYDAYARVCVALGMRQMLQAITYYLIGVCMVENRAPTVALALILSFQTASVLVCMLDIYHQMGCCGSCFYQVTGRCGNFDLQVSSVLPAFAAYLAVFVAPHESDTANGPMEKKVANATSIPCFVLEVIWFQLLLSVSKPTSDDAALPRYWRTVLFMDVFSEGSDPMEVDVATGLKKLTMEERTVVEQRVSAACTTLIRAQAALRRWDAVPKDALNKVQKEMLTKCRKDLKAWVSLLGEELSRRRLPGLSEEQERPRPWHDLTRTERLEDPLAGSLLGPFEHFVGMGMRSHYFFDLENEQYRYRGDIDGWHVLTVGETVATCKLFEKAVEYVLEASGDSDRTGQREDEDEGDFPPPPLLMSEEAYEAEYGEFGAGSVACSSEDDGGEHPALVRRFTSKFQMLRGKKPPVHVVPERLPWQLVRGLTRLLQLVWALMGLVITLESLDVLTIDLRVYTSDKRRLSSVGAVVAPGDEPLPWLPMATLGVDWPYGSFFKPEALLCGGVADAASASASAPRGPPQVVVVGRAALYQAVNASSRGGVDVGGEHGHWRLNTLRGAPYPRAFAALCANAGPGGSEGHSGAESAANASQCLLVSPTEDGLLFRTLWHSTSRSDDGSGSGAVLLQVADSSAAVAPPTAPWRLLAGASLPCDAFAADSGEEGASGAAGADARRSDGRIWGEVDWCLLLAGWARGPRVAVAVLPLPGGPGRPPPPGERVVPQLDLELPRPRLPRGPEETPSTSTGPSALHVDARTGRLLAVTAGGELAAWELLRGGGGGGPLRGRLLGAWRLRWPAGQDGGALASAVCAHPRNDDGRVLVAGRDAAGPWLLQTCLPPPYGSGPPRSDGNDGSSDQPVENDRSRG